MKNLIRRFCAALFATLLRLRSRRYAFPECAALIVAPHADDETLGCGGLIAAKRQRKQAVHVLFVTDSGASHPGHPLLTPGQIVKTRRAEAITALEVLGVPADHVSFFDVPDGTLNQLTPTVLAALAEQLAAHIRELGATEIFTPYREDGSSEHTVVHGVTAAACRKCGLPTLLEYPVWAWWNSFRLGPRLARSNGNFRLELGDFRALKQRALGCHHSQTNPLPPATEAALPPILARLCCGSTEFFFQRST